MIIVNCLPVTVLYVPSLQAGQTDLFPVEYEPNSHSVAEVGEQ